MRYPRVGPAGAERPAVLDDDGNAFDLRELTEDIDGAFLAGDGHARTRSALAEGRLPRRDLNGLRVGAPVARPGKVVRVGLNHRAHAAETGAPAPDGPVVLMPEGPEGLEDADAVIAGFAVADDVSPAGAAFGANHFPHLRAGDLVEVEIEGLGRQRHVVGQA
ncbi:hypothetical protein [Streptomyces profundus]|uniref:hypothetical protein n=1 Tax=Streptomyces profundus TaxID=2867410 RepID=UPI001D1650D8|nr:hypothetical protein [Streptomyces sp. MA3_2.13]UED87608.1 hypothetical protein K4G22_28210 [Streptomyces sp. MA3_2.13]